MSQFQTWDLQIMKQQNKIYTKSTRQGTNLSHQGKKEKSSTQKWFLMGYVSSLGWYPLILEDSGLQKTPLLMSEFIARKSLAHPKLSLP